MSTRTTGKRGKRETLEERVKTRYMKSSAWVSGETHARDELQRVARQVRKLYQTEGRFYGDGTCVRRADVLALIRKATR